MARKCGPCCDKRRKEIDRRLLEKDITGESFRRLVKEFGYSETSFRRHLKNHIAPDLDALKKARDEAKEKVLKQARVEAMEQAKASIETATASQMSLAGSFLDQLETLRNKATEILTSAENAEDLKTALMGIREARSCIEVLAKIEGKINDNPSVTVINSAEWMELRTVIITALDPYPEAKAAVVNVIRGR